MSAGEMLVFARCLGFVFRAPGFSHPAVPPPLRAGLAYLLAVALRVAHAPAREPAAAGFAFALASETLVGAGIGLAASMLYDGAYAGGRALDDYAGIRASVPSADVAAGAGFGRLWSLAFVTAYFVFGGYRVTVVALAGSLTALPAGTLARASDLQTFALTLPDTLLRAALFVAGPAFAIAFLAQAALAIVARLVPRFSTFTLAFPVVFAGMLLATIAGLASTLSAASNPWLDISALRAR